MSAADWVIVVAYLAGMVGLSAWLGRRQASEGDYYVAGRRLPWWAVGVSTMATQSSANSFLGIPAFVALREGGGLSWLQYELAVPLAIIPISVFLVPFFRGLGLVSVYEYLERRFDRRVRLVLSFVFLVSRGLATGVAVYAAALVLAVCLEIPVWATVLLIAAVTVLYDTIGGMSAVVWSDVIQMGVLLVGLAGSVLYVLAEAGSWHALATALPAERWVALRPGTGLGDGETLPLWGFLLGGLVLYASYYGVDQSQVQRELSAPNERETRLSLIFNGLARFPLTLAYVVFGIALAWIVAHDPRIGGSSELAADPNRLVPLFIVHHLPEGFRALLVAAILAAAMSSLDSALNSLSAATETDFLRDRGLGPRQRLRRARLVTLAWGAAIGAAALFFALRGGILTVVESINKVGSAFYGPVLAAYLAGLLWRRANARGILVGVATGVAFNLVLGTLLPGLFFMWWNLGGLLAAALGTVFGSLSAARPRPEQLRGTMLGARDLWARERPWMGAHALLAGWFLLILAITASAAALAP